MTSWPATRRAPRASTTRGRGRWVPSRSGTPSAEDSARVRARRELRVAERSPRRLQPDGNPATVRWGTFANFAFTAPADTDIVRVTLWRYGIGRLGTDNPNTPENESGRFEVSAIFGPGNKVFADSCQPGSADLPEPVPDRLARLQQRVQGGPRRTRRRLLDRRVLRRGHRRPEVQHERRRGRRVHLRRLPGRGRHARGQHRPAHDGERLPPGGRLAAASPTRSRSRATDNSGIKQLRLEVDGQVITEPNGCLRLHAAGPMPQRSGHAHRTPASRTGPTLCASWAWTPPATPASCSVSSRSTARRRPRPSSAPAGSGSCST